MNNPYTSEATYKRMCHEYYTYGTLFIAFDFDNTIQDFKTKEPYYDIIELLQILSNKGAKLILYTCADRINEKLKFCQEHNIKVTYVNENPEVNFGGKLYYNVLLDDRAGLEEVKCNLNRFINEQF